MNRISKRRYMEGRIGRLIPQDIIRTKHPDADPKLKYGKAIRTALCLSLLLHLAAAIVYPRRETRRSMPPTPLTVIHVEEIPEIRQVFRPAPTPRPQLPLTASEEALPEDFVIIEKELDFDPIEINLPSIALEPRSEGAPFEEEAIFDIDSVDRKPRLIGTTDPPEYPRAALRSGRQGTVHVSFVVDRAGKVQSPEVVNGPNIFHASALQAVSRFRFIPAKRGDLPVLVRMVLPIQFHLTRG